MSNAPAREGSGGPVEPTPLELMRYHDGELTPEEAVGVERYLVANPAGRAQVSGLEQVGDLLREMAVVRGAGAGDIADAVMAALPPEAPDTDGPVDGTIGPPPTPRAPSAGEPGRVLPLFRRRLVGTGAVLAGTLAAAAAAILLLRAPGAGNEEGPSPVAEAEPPHIGAVAPGSEEEESGVEIESVDFGARNGTIFLVKGGEQTTPVVWLTDEVSDTGQKMETL